MLSLAAFVFVAFAAAAVGSRFRPDAWHAALAKPAWNPPNWVFAPVWTVLYLCIAVAGWLVWRAEGDARNVALVNWALQLAANAAWTWLFFGRHRIGGALVDLCATIAFSVLFAAAAVSVDARAAWLFVPYLAWLGFAAVLNAAIWRLNRSAQDEPLPTQL